MMGFNKNMWIMVYAAVASLLSFSAQAKAAQWGLPTGQVPIANDLAVIESGGKQGVLVYKNGGTYEKVIGVSPLSITMADLDGSGKDELIAIFPNSGVGIRYNDVGSFIQPPFAGSAIPSKMVTGDLDGDGKMDLILDYPRGGIWVYMNNTYFVQILYYNTYSARAQRMGAVDLDGNGLDDIVFDFGFGSRWAYMAYPTYSSWVSLDSSGMESSFLLIGDYDGNGLSDIIIDHTIDGSVWGYMNNSGIWTSLHTNIAAGVTAAAIGDLNNDGLDDVVLDISSGVWELPGGTYNYGGPTTQYVNPGMSGRNLLIYDHDSNGVSDLIVGGIHNTTLLTAPLVLGLGIAGGQSGMAVGNLDGL